MARLFSEFLRPILYERHRFAVFFKVAAIEEEFLSIRSDVVRTRLALDSHGMEEDMRNAKFDHVPKSAHIDGHNVVRQIQEEEFLSVLAPSGIGASTS